MKRIVFITGYYGSGKTEVALNLAKQMNVDYLIDLDIINPYFRSREFKQQLDDHIEVIASDLADDQYSDLPYLSKKIFLPFHQKDKTAIYDLGGNDLGAKIIKQFGREDMRDGDLFVVINMFRPETKDVQSSIDVIKAIELTSGMKVTGLINNTNLLKETSYQDIKLGEDMVKQVSSKTNIPVIFTCVEQSLNINHHTFSTKILKMKRYFNKKQYS